jgi:hypothetical protein
LPSGATLAVTIDAEELARRLRGRFEEADQLPADDRFPLGERFPHIAQLPDNERERILAEIRERARHVSTLPAEERERILREERERAELLPAHERGVALERALHLEELAVKALEEALQRPQPRGPRPRI